ncbi:hypothetical protein Ava_B0255 (plasmid) [Trichormus variabilis ATCC 29413]|uniref:Uncharacterized protein n=2 Tax=Anabaena variabilis TaxID=264691 RepID=Q3M220_TRIV2|nr:MULTISPECIES: hypothetical protein [Nostocaceae]ABA24966.1 hypothetical protein Ava_B0255 [Trichormus variabilis ATCC 29413]MBC1217810.1 hypothetical protein [Trichormus variabilis ARAD]MBC1305598.1 hypothetical protein [Trichormus variabilis N2B]MBC1314826.1 hypothetical protein [Trichormus variabilis PNB]MBC1329788.1 hypothetical protein [Trichormus variabilis 9RC]
MTPQEYAQKYNLKATTVAHEHCISENAYRRQILSTKNKNRPAATTCRISQLLNFIREHGLEPPNPIFFD